MSARGPTWAQFSAWCSRHGFDAADARRDIEQHEAQLEADRWMAEIRRLADAGPHLTGAKWSRFADPPVHPVYTSGAKGPDLSDACASHPSENLAFSVPGDRIELPTRGFSIRQRTKKEGQNMSISTCAVHRVYTGPPLARTRPDTLAPFVADLELWELGATGTRGES